MKNHVIIALLGVALGAPSCENTMEFDGAGREPKMIVGALIGPNEDPTDDRHTVSVAESVFIFGDREPRPVTGASFTIRRNGAEVQKDVEEYDGQTYTLYRFPVVAGDLLELEGSSPLHGKVSASDVVPAPADFRRLETEWFKGGKGGTYYYATGDEWYLRTRVTIADPAGERNYYRFTARSLTRYMEKYQDWVSGQGLVELERESEIEREQAIYVDSEIAFSNAVGDPAMGSMTWSAISDELFDGREYTFDVYIQLDRSMSDSFGGAWSYEYEILSQNVTVEVQTLSENLFKYRRSADIQSYEHNFSEPTRIYSNVTGGYGIFGTYNVASKTAELELLETDD